MDYMKTNAPTNTQTRDIMELCKETGNIYESVVILAKRSNQIGQDIKAELTNKLKEFATRTDNLEEILRTVSRLRFHVSMRSFQSQH